MNRHFSLDRKTTQLKQKTLFRFSSHFSSFFTVSLSFKLVFFAGIKKAVVPLKKINDILDIGMCRTCMVCLPLAALYQADANRKWCVLTQTRRQFSQTDPVCESETLFCTEKFTFLTAGKKIATYLLEKWVHENTRSAWHTDSGVTERNPNKRPGSTPSRPWLHAEWR